jgi:quercetin dioxygenase-like cupin family protein
MLSAKNLFTLAPIVFAPGLFAQTPPPLIDNDQVRVLRAVDRAHEKSAPHEHTVNRVMVYLTAGRQEFTDQGRKSVLEYKAGDVKWSPAVVSHVSEVTSGGDVNIIELEIKKPGDPRKSPDTPLDSLKVDPKDYHLEFENSQVRVIRVKVPAHQNIPLHEHLLNRVVVYLTDQHGSSTTTDDVAQHKAGDVSWGTPMKHKEQNLSDKPLETLVIELKD